MGTVKASLAYMASNPNSSVAPTVPARRVYGPYITRALKTLSRKSLSFTAFQNTNFTASSSLTCTNRMKSGFYPEN